jgi:septum formation protein
MKKIILASNSPRRKDLLKQIGLEFEIDPSNYQEDMTLKMEPRKLAEHLSLGKSEEVAKRHKDAIIISADTIIVIGGEIFGKPKTESRARYMLEKLSGNVHSVITGFTIIDTATNKKITKSVETKVYFRRISGEEIDAYIGTGEPLDKGGSYAIQGIAALFVEKIEGDYFNVVGLPIAVLASELKDFGVKIL